MRNGINKSKLEIIDLRISLVDSEPYSYPIIKLKTNQGIEGIGEARDGSDPRNALRFKALLLGMNPLNIDKIFQAMKKHIGITKYGWSGTGGRESGGISGIEMALWDIAGKVHEAPVYQLLGGKHRNRVRIYADTPQPENPTPENYAKKAAERIETGVNFLKLDLGIPILKELDESDLLTENSPTEKGIEYLVSCLEAVRREVGWDIPIAIDHLGRLSIEDCKRLGRALEVYNLAWIEDPRPWSDLEGYREITKSTNVPTLTGEGIFSLEGFRNLIDKRAVRKIHPDPGTAGGLRETKRIADYAGRNYISTALHCAGSPISFMANVHVAAAIKDFVALENHALDIPWWENLVRGLPEPLMESGYVKVPEKPGLGLELNSEEIKEHLKHGGYFRPTDDWNQHEVFKF